jgi:hypothetical protein
MLLMDRENLFAPGWSHVLSSRNDLGELEALRERVGAPPGALHRKNPKRPHLDLKLEPRARALTDSTVQVFETTRELLIFWETCQPAPAARERK